MQEEIVKFLIENSAEIKALAVKAEKMKPGGYSEAEKAELAKDSKALLIKFLLG